MIANFVSKFYENWIMLDSNSPVITAELPIPNSAVATAELQSNDYQIDIHQSISISDVGDFPIEHFFNTPFTHHIKILEKASEMAERYYYISRCACEHMSVDEVEKIIKQDAFHHKSLLPNNFINTISDPASARKAVMMFKDEYFLDFINTEEIGERDFADIDEKVVEKEIIHNVKNFIMTFGKGFTFNGSQVHYDKFGHDHWIDHLFYNRDLRQLI